MNKKLLLLAILTGACSNVAAADASKPGPAPIGKRRGLACNGTSREKTNLHSTSFRKKLNEQQTAEEEHEAEIKRMFKLFEQE